jgi:hypothetical protein
MDKVRTRAPAPLASSLRRGLNNGGGVTERLYGTWEKVQQGKRVVLGAFASLWEQAAVGRQVCLQAQQPQWTLGLALKVSCGGSDVLCSCQA